jgi:two-component system chemotaxis response regulator CheY
MKEHVLVITENKNHEIILRKKLKELPLIFIAGNDALEEKLSHLRFSFILIDDSEGEFDSLKVIRAIKENSNTAASPILMITGSLQRDYIEALTNAGVSDFISTPLSHENVYQTLIDKAAIRKQEQVIGKIQIPTGIDKPVNLSDHQVIHQEAIDHVKKAFKEKKLVTLALVKVIKAPEIACDLSLRVRDNLFCVISLDKGRKQLLDSLRKGSKDNLYAGIVSSKKKAYNGITPMLTDAEAALKRALESPYRYSF